MLPKRSQLHHIIKYSMPCNISASFDEDNFQHKKNHYNIIENMILTNCMVFKPFLMKNLLSGFHTFLLFSMRFFLVLFILIYLSPLVTTPAYDTLQTAHCVGHTQLRPAGMRWFVDLANA